MEALNQLAIVFMKGLVGFGIIALLVVIACWIELWLENRK